MGRLKLNRKVLQVRVSADTSDKLKAMALKLGFQYGDDGNTGAFLDAIAQLPIEKIKVILEEQKYGHG